MGNRVAYCGEVLNQANNSSIGYLITGVVAFAFMLVVPFVLAAPLERVKFLGKVQKLLRSLVKWFDLDTTAIQTKLEVPTAGTAGAAGANKEAESTDESEDSSFLLNFNKRRDMTEFVKLVGGFLTILLILINLYFCWFIIFSYDAPLTRSLEVHPAMLYKTYTLNLMVTVDAPCANPDTECPNYSLKYDNPDTATFTDLAGVTCKGVVIDSKQMCEVTGNLDIDAGMLMLKSQLLTKEYHIKFAGYPIKSDKEVSNIIMKFASKQKRMGVEGLVPVPQGDDVYVFSDSCRRVQFNNANSQSIFAVTHYRKRCNQQFGSIDRCESVALAFPTVDSVDVDPRGAATGEAMLTLEISPIALNSALVSKNRVIIFVLIIVSIMSIFTLQPVLKRFISNYFINMIRRRITGKGIGIGRGLVAGVSASVIILGTAAVLFFFFSEVLFEYESRLPKYSMSDIEFYAFLPDLGLIVTDIYFGIFLGVISLALCLGVIAVSVFYVGLSSKAARIEAEETQNISTVSDSAGYQNTDL